MIFNEKKAYTVGEISCILKSCFENPAFQNVPVYGEVYSIRLGKFSYIDLGDLLEHRLPRMGVRFVSRAEGIDLPGVRTALSPEGAGFPGASSAVKGGSDRVSSMRCSSGVGDGIDAGPRVFDPCLPVGALLDPDEDLMLGLMAICNNYYSMQLSRSVRCSMTASWRRGEHVQPFAPFGYVFDKSSRGRLRIDPEAARCVAWMFELAAGGMRARDIARELQGAGMPTPAAYALARAEGKSHCHKGRPTPWNARKVRAILRRETYAGVLVGGITRSVGVGKGSPKRTTAPGERVRVENAHEAIVSWEVFVAAQEVLK